MGAAQKLHKKSPAAAQHHDDDHGHHEEGGHAGEPWLVSYADMMTLLFGFFVILYSLAMARLDDDEAMVRMRKEVATYFGGEYVTPMSKALEEFKKQVGGQVIARNLDTKLFPEGFEVTLQSQALFDSGEADLKPEAQKAIKQLIQVVKNKGGTKFKVSVEGHTDDIPIRTRRFPSNWELSGARAAAVIRIFESFGFNGKNLSAIGYADTRPAAPNRDAGGRLLAENQMKNRRVKIRVMMLDDVEPVPKDGVISKEAVKAKEAVKTKVKAK